jgi:hypothetical protein
MPLLGDDTIEGMPNIITITTATAAAAAAIVILLITTARIIVVVAIITAAEPRFRGSVSYFQLRLECVPAHIQTATNTIRSSLYSPG